MTYPLRDPRRRPPAGLAALSAPLAACLLFVACEPPAREEPAPAFDAQTVVTPITNVLDRQVAAWNRGDIEEFMAGYLRSPELRFASGNEVHRGWNQTLERYRRNYPDRAAMGTLAFEDLDVRVLSEHAAIVFGRFRLSRESDEPTGLFTLLFERHDGEWVIVADHTSSEQ